MVSSQVGHTHTKKNNGKNTDEQRRQKIQTQAHTRIYAKSFEFFFVSIHLFFSGISENAKVTICKRSFISVETVCKLSLLR